MRGEEGTVACKSPLGRMDSPQGFWWTGTGGLLGAYGLAAPGPHKKSTPAKLSSRTILDSMVCCVPQISASVSGVLIEHPCFGLREIVWGESTRLLQIHLI